MPKFQSTKLIDGFSTCFRQWKAQHTHCAKLHGYAISFNVTFEGDLDQYNWVVDFGFMKRSTTTIDGKTPAAYFSWMFDHTVVIAVDDPEANTFEMLHDKGLIQLRVIKEVGCEKFAQFVAGKLNDFLKKETKGRVKVIKVECFEHAKNSAIYIP